MSGPLVLEVRGMALWAPRLPAWDTARDVLLGRAQAPEAAATRPAPALLAPTERRRAPDTVALALEVATRACTMAGVQPDAIPSVFASTHGDLPISDYMCATLAATPALLSPTRFHNSVHNAAVGYWTIGTGCLQPSTALTAWGNTFAMGLLEAAMQAVTDGTPVLYVAYDVAARGPLATVTKSDGLLAVALVLAPPGWSPPADAGDANGRAARGGHRTLELQLRVGSAPAGTPIDTGPWDTLVAGNAMQPALPLLAALAHDAPATLRLAAGTGSHLELRLGSAP